MAVNKEIFGMLVFFIGIVVMISLVAGSTVSTTNVTTFTLSSGNQSIGSVQVQATQPQNTTCAIAYLPFPENFEVMMGIKPLSSFCSTPLNSLGQGNLLTGQQIGPVSITGPVSIKTGSLTDLVSNTIIIAVLFVGLGLLAGFLGAGILAPIISSVGIGLSLIYFMQSVLASEYFSGIPPFMSIFLTGLTGGMFIWIVIVLLK